MLVFELAALMALVAVFGAVLGVVAGWFSSRIGEGLIYDLRTAGLRPRAADVAGVLHPHPDRRPGQPPQQRRDRRPAGVHLDAVRQVSNVISVRRRRHRDVRAQLADHPAVPAPVPAAVPAPRALVGTQARRAHPRADGPQRRHGQRDDRAVQRLRRACWSSCSAGAPTRTRCSPTRPARSATSASGIR